MSKAILTANFALFSTKGGVLSVLLIERRKPPFQGFWALPGGHVEKNETFERAALREFTEETGLPAPHDWRQVGIFDAPDRDPRGRTVSVAYAYEITEQPEPTAGNDALRNGAPIAFDHQDIIASATRLASVRA